MARPWDFGDFLLAGFGTAPKHSAMNSEIEENVRRKVGGSLDRLPPLQRLTMLRRNAIFLRGGKWLPDQNDGTRIRKVVGLAR